MRFCSAVLGLEGRPINAACISYCTSQIRLHSPQRARLTPSAAASQPHTATPHTSTAGPRSLSNSYFFFSFFSRSTRMLGPIFYVSSSSSSVHPIRPLHREDFRANDRHCHTTYKPRLWLGITSITSTPARESIRIPPCIRITLAQRLHRRTR